MDFYFSTTSKEVEEIFSRKICSFSELGKEVVEAVSGRIFSLARRGRTLKKQEIG